MSSSNTTLSTNPIVLTASNLLQKPMSSNSSGTTLMAHSLPPITLAAPMPLIPQNQTTPGSASPNSSNTTNTSSSYGGFAHCSNCGDYGVKAAFYGKSKLYCSVACQNGIKQQQQQTQGTKRTIESLNYSSSGSANNSPLPSNSVNQLQTPTPLLTITNKPMLQQTSILDTPPQSSQVQHLQMSTTTNTNLIKAPDNLSLLEAKPTSEPIQLQASTGTGQIQGNQVFLINNKLKPDVKATLLPEVGQQGSVIKYTAKTNGNNIEPSAKRARNNSNSSTNSTMTAISSTTVSSFVQHSVTDTSNPLSEFQWASYIEKHNSEAAPVYLFKHAPMRQYSLNNLVVEVPIKDLPEDILSYSKSGTSECYWFARVIDSAGYLVKLRYFGYDDEDNPPDFWMHMYDDDLHPVGWTSIHDFSLVPPESIIDKHEWSEYCVQKLVGFKTIQNDFKQKITKSLNSKFKCGMLLEVANKHKLSTMRVARIIQNTGGRLRLKYENSEDFDDFYCHELSEIIHPIGWSVTVGHDIDAPEDYKKKSAIKYEKNQYEANECSPDMFVKIKETDKDIRPFKAEMKLEAIDPLNLSAICVATVKKVLRNDYLMVKIDGYTLDDLDTFCYHRTSSSILPTGFCQIHSIKLKEPFGHKGKFKWKSYLKATNSQFAPVDLFYKDPSVQNPFKVGMKIESVDLMNPKMVCVATVIAVVDRLIRVHFDGWEPEYDQWIDFESCNIYPVGFCQLVGLGLNEPGSLDIKPKQGKKVKRRKC